MDRGEPTLVPQWLKNNASSPNGRGVRFPSFSSYSPRSDDHSLVKHTRNVSSGNTGDKASEKTTATYFHRNSSSRGSTHPQSYGSFGSRSNRNGDTIKFYNKEKIGGVNRGANHSDYLDSRLRRKFEKDELQRSKSMNGWKDEGARRRNHASDVCNETINYRSSGDVVLGSGNGITEINEPSFDKDFPSLVSDENRVSPEIGRVPSPGFQRQLSPTSDGWTSVLAEAPGANGSGSSSGLASSQVASNASAPLPLSASAPNMAEAVAQIPLRARTPPELSVSTQRLEELAIKKSKQLIPMTPTTPRSHMSSTLDKPKTRMLQPQVKPSPSPSLSGNQPLRTGPLKLDAVKSSNLSKFQVLKSLKDMNGVYAAGKEMLGSLNGASVSTSTFSEAPSTGSPPAGNSPHHQSLAGLERKPAVVSVNLERKPSLQAQSRIEFFSRLKKKSSSSSSPICNEHSLSPTLLEKPDSSSAMPITSEMKNPSSAPALDRGIENEIVVISASNGDGCTVTRRHTVSGEEQLFPLGEEYFAFLRSLGWEESSGEDEEGLTEEEINSFLKECANMSLSSHSLSVQKMALQLKSGLDFSCAPSLSMPQSES